MASLSASDIRFINDKLKIDEVLKAIDYRTDTIQKAGNRYRCFCPIHKEEVFRSLTIDADNRTFRCGYNLCKGSRGGTLLDLFSLATGKTREDSAQHWATLLKIEIKPGSPEEESSTPKNKPEKTSAPSTVKPHAQAEPAKPQAKTGAPSLPPKTEQPMTRLSQEVTGVFVAPDLNAPTAAERVAEALKLAQGGKADKALDILEGLLELDPYDWDAGLAAARIYNSIGQKEPAIRVLKLLAYRARESNSYERALLAYSQLVEISPEDLECQDALADIHKQRGDMEKAAQVLERAADTCLRTSKKSEAAKRFLAIIQLQPNLARPYEALAEIFISSGRKDQAVHVLVQAAKVYRERDLVGKSAETWQRILSIEPNHVEVHEALAQIALDRGQQEEAIRHYESVADIYQGQDRVDSALSLYQRVVALDPGNTEIRNRLALVYKHLGQLDKANEQYLEIISIYQKKDLIGRAINVARRLLQQDPLNDIIRRKLIDMLAEKDDEEKVLAEWQAMAQAHQAAGNTDRAIDACFQAAQFQPAHGPIHLELAALLFSANQADRAVDAAINFLKRCPSNEISPSLEALLLEKAGEDIRVQEYVRTRDSRLAQAQNAVLPSGAVQPEKPALDQALLLLDAGQPQDACDLLVALAAEEPGRPEIQEGLAKALLALNRDEECINAAMAAGEIHRKRGDLGAAQEVFQLALEAADRWKTREEDRNKARAKIAEALGDIHFAAGKTREAATSFLQAAKLSPERPDLYGRAADAAARAGNAAEACQLTLLAADALEKQNNLTGALNYLERARYLSEPEAALHQRCAELYLRVGQKNSAARSYRSAAELLCAKNDADGIKQAESFYARIIEIDPDDAQAYSDLAQVIDKRLALTGETIRPHPATAVYACLADLYSRKNLPGKAQEILQLALALEPDDAGLKRQMIAAYCDSGAIDRAVSLYEELAGSALETDSLKAVSILEEAVAIDPKNTALHEKIIAAHRAAGRIAETGIAYQRLAGICEEQGLVGRRIAVLEEQKKLYLEQNPAAFKKELIETTETLARIYADKGEEENAGAAYVDVVRRMDSASFEPAERLDFLRRSVEVAPGSLHALRALAECYEDLDRADDAVRTYLQIDRIAGSRRDIRPREQQQIREECHRAILEIVPDRLDSLRALAALFDETENLVETEEAYQNLFQALVRCIETIPAEGETPDSAGLGALRKEAVRVGRRIVKINPKRIAVHRRMGEIYESLEDYEQARECHFALLRSYRADLPPLEAIERHRDDPSRLQQTCIPQFLETANKIMGLDGLCERPAVSPDLYELVGDVHRALDNPSEAVFYLAGAVDLYSESGRREEAIAVCRRILEINPDRYEIRLRLSELLESRGLKEEAIRERVALAELYETNGEADAALEQLKRVIQLAPSHPEPREMAARIALSLGDLAGAKAMVLELGRLEAAGEPDQEIPLARLEQIRVMDPSDIEIRRTLVKACLRRGEVENAIAEALQTAALLSEQSDISAALACLKEVLPAAPTHRELHEQILALLEKEPADIAGLTIRSAVAAEQVRYGRTTMEARSLDEAEEAFQKALALNAENTDALAGLIEVYRETEAQQNLIEHCRRLGRIWLKQGAAAAARDCFEQVLSLSPDDAEAASALADLHADEGSRQDAAGELRRLADALKRSGDSAKAIFTFRKLLDLDPEDRATRLDLADLLLSSGQKEEALRLRQAAMVKAERDGRLDEALADAEFIQTHRPEDVEIHSRIAEFHLAQGRISQAVEHLLETAEQKGPGREAAAFFLRAHEIDPDHWDLFVRAARSLIEAEDRPAALALCHRRLAEKQLAGSDDQIEAICQFTLELAPDDPVALAALAAQASSAGDLNKAIKLHVRLCETHVAAGRIVEVIEHLLKATRAHPDSIELQRMLAERYESVGNYRDASSAYDNAARLAARSNEWKTVVELRRALLRLNEHGLDAHRACVEALAQLRETEGEATVPAETLNEARLNLLGEFLRTPDRERFADEIERLVNDITAVDARNIQAWEAYAEVFRNMDPNKAWRAMYEAARLWLDKGETERARNLYLRLRRSRRLSTSQWQNLTETLSAVASEEERFADLIAFARAAAEDGHFAESGRRFLDLAERYPDRLDFQEEMVEILERAEMREEAREARIRIADTCASLNEIGKAVRWYQAAMRHPFEPGRGELDPADLALVHRIADALFAGHRLRESVDLLLAAGSEMEKRQDLDSAEDCYNRALREQPEEADAHHGLIRIHLARGDKGRATECLTDLAAAYRRREMPARAAEVYVRALEISSSSLLRRSLAETYLEMGNQQQAWPLFQRVAASLAETGDPDGAIDLYRRLLENYSQATQPRLHYADLLLSLGNQAEGIQELLNLARLYLENDLPGKAQETLRRIVEIEPAHAGARERLAGIFIDRGQEDRAAAEYLEMGAALEKSGRNAEAIQAYEHCLEIDPSSEPAARSLIVLLEPQAAEKAPRLIPLYLDRAESLLSTGHAEAALEICNKAESLGAADARFKRLRDSIEKEIERRKPVLRMEDQIAQARELARSGEKTGAVKLLREALAAEPASEQAALLLADLLIEDGLLDEAARLLVDTGNTALGQQKLGSALHIAEQARRVLPDSALVLRFAAGLCLREGKRPQAASLLVQLAGILARQEPASTGDSRSDIIEILYEAIRTDPDNLDARFHLADLLKGSEKRDEGARLYGEAALLLVKRHPDQAESRITEALRLYRDCRVSRTATPEMLREEIELRESFARLLLHRGETTSAAQEDLEAGRLARSLDLYEEACAAYSRVLDADLPEDRWLIQVESAEGIAEISRTRGQRDRAVESWRRAVEVSLAHGDTDRALLELDSILSLEPNDRLALERKAHIYREAGDFDAYRNAIHALAGVYRNLNLVGKAEALYLELVEAEIDRGLNPEDSFETLVQMYADRGAAREIERVRMRLAESYREVRRKEPEIQLYCQILQDNPQHEETRRRLLLCCRSEGPAGSAYKALLSTENRLHDEGHIEAAIRCLWELVTVGASLETLFARLGEYYQRLGNPEEGVKKFRQMADAYAMTGQFANAALCYQQIVTLSPADPKARHRHIECLMESGSFAEAAREALDAGAECEGLNDVVGAWRFLELAREVCRACPTDEVDSILEEINARISVIQADYTKQTRRQDMASAYRRAEEFLRIKDEKSAIAEYEQILQRYPDDARALEALTGIYTRQAQRGNAEAAEKGIQLLLQVAGEREKRRDYASAMEAVRSAVTLDPVRNEPRYALARLLRATGRHEEATNEILLLAKEHRDAGRFQEAVAAYDHLLEFSPGDTSLLGKKAAVLSAVNDLAGAVAVLKKQAEAYVSREMVPRAVSVFHRVLELAPNDLDARKDLVRLLILKGDKAGATQQGREILDRVIKNGDHSAALGILHELMEMDPEDPRWRFEAARVKRESGDIPGAVQDLWKAHEIYLQGDLIGKASETLSLILQWEPDNERAGEALISACVAKGQLRKAAEECARMARRMAETNRLREAAAAFERALEFDPGDLDILEAGAAVFRKLGETSKAGEWLLRAVEIKQSRGDESAVASLLEDLLASPDIQGALPLDRCERIFLERIRSLESENDATGAITLRDQLGRMYENRSLALEAAEQYVSIARLYRQLALNAGTASVTASQEEDVHA